MTTNVEQMNQPRHNFFPSPDGRSRRSFIKDSVTAGVGSLLMTSASIGELVATQRTRLGRSQTNDLTQLSLRDVSELTRTGKISPVELTRACLQRIERLNPLINAFITVTAENALVQARQAEREIQRGRWRGSLHGIPIGLKDNIDTALVKTTAASAVFANRVPAEDAEVVRRLKSAGAVIIGKLNLDEFAIGHTTTLSHFGPVHNPWKLDHITGGSSGGSAAAVSARLCYGALGTDTGGSIRIPSGYCGTVGLKPTYGLVSTRGVVPLSWSLDHVGLICRRVADAALVLSAISGYDPEEPTSLNAPAVNYAAAIGVKTSALRVGVVRALFSEVADPEIEAAVNDAVVVIRSLTRSIFDTELPPIREGTWVNVALAEAYAFHAPLLATEPQQYHPVIRARAELGSTITAKSHIEARRHVEQLRRNIRSTFADVDLLVAPTAYTSPMTIERSFKEQQQRPPSTPTPAFNIYGLPAITVPCGFTSSGLPTGVQIIGPPLGEGKVLALAYAYEAATQWSKRSPVF